MHSGPPELCWSSPEGPGTWTAQLLRYADTLTALDGASEMLSIAAAAVGQERVRFIQADIFSWQPDRRYDVVFFGFWLSHVPDQRFEAFWSLVGACLKPGGRVLFLDDGYRGPDELVDGEASSTVRRKLNDGSAFQIVKAPLEAAELEQRLAELGWSVTITQTAGPFFWGAGGRA